MRNLFLLFAAFVAVLSAKAETTRPIVTTAPGEESIYRGEVMAARALDGDVTKLDEIYYRINFDGDKAYIYNLFSISDPVGEYVVADIVDNKIYVPTGFVYRDLGYIVVMVKRFVKDSSGEWAIDNGDEPVIWTIEEDGVISDKDKDVKMGLVFYIVGDDEDPGSISCLFDDISLYPADITTTELPANVVDCREFRRYVNYEMEGDYTNMVIKVARDGNDFYFKNLYNDSDSMEIDCWIKGSLEDGFITIPSRQLVGVDKRGYFCYNAKTYIDWEKGEFVIDEEPVKFTFDEQSESMSTNDWLLITQGYNYPFYYFPTPELFLFELVEAVPAQPVYIDYNDEWFDYFGTVDFVFLLPYEDVNGNFIDPENMSFSIFMDSDKPYVFEPEQYPAFMEPVSEFGFYDMNKYVVNTGADGKQRHIVYLTTNSYEKIGVQSYYTVNGVRNASAIMWYDRNGLLVDKVEAEKDVSHVETYDLMGRKVSNDTKGVVVRRVTYTDGTVKSFKETAR